jgi:hypothetical protein
MRDLVVRGDRTFGEFQQAGRGIATNILAARPKNLEATVPSPPNKIPKTGAPNSQPQLFTKPFVSRFIRKAEAEGRKPVYQGK